MQTGFIHNKQSWRHARHSRALHKSWAKLYSKQYNLLHRFLDLQALFIRKQPAILLLETGITPSLKQWNYSWGLKCIMYNETSKNEWLVEKVWGNVICWIQDRSQEIKNARDLKMRRLWEVEKNQGWGSRCWRSNVTPWSNKSGSYQPSSACKRFYQ